MLEITLWDHVQVLELCYLRDKNRLEKDGHKECSERW